MDNSFSKFKCKNQTTCNIFSTDYSNQLINLNLFLTDRCNLNCKYCFVNQGNNIMSLEMADKAIAWGLKHMKKDNKLTVSFFGGEPLLQFNSIIKPIVEKYGSSLNYRITTNGILLNKEICQLFQQYNFSILFSFDGIKKVQNKQRDNSFEKSLMGLKLALIYFPKLKVRLTLTKYSMPYLYKSILFLNSIGVKYIDINPNIYENWSFLSQKIFEFQCKKIIQFLKDNKDIEIQPFTDLFNILFEQQKFNNNFCHCGLGTSGCSIDAFGDIYPCQEYVTLNDKKNYQLGNIIDGYDKIKHQLFLEKYAKKLNTLNCTKKCHYFTQQFCISQLCPSKLFVNDFKKSPTECKYFSSLIKIFLQNYNLF